MEFVHNNQKIIVSALAFVLIMSFAVFAGPESCAETGNGGPVTEVTVTNVDELLNAVAPNTCITLKAGTYNLSTASTYGGLNGGACWRWQEAYDGYELTIESIDNLTIRGEGKDLVTILAEPRYATVLNFNRCTNVTLKGFTAGHTEAPAFCAGNVLGFNNCQETAIENCGMFGCGVIGIYAQNCTDMTVKNSDIYDCSYGAVYLYGSRNVMVDGCSIRDHGSEGTDTSVAYLFCLDSSDNISIRNSVIKDNYVQNLLAMGYSRNVVFAGNTVEKNSFFSSVFSSQRNSPVVEGCSFSNNSINSWYENNDVYAVDASGKSLGKEELEGMVRREIGEDENLIPERTDSGGKELVSPGPDGAFHVNTVDELLSVIGNDRTIILEAEYYDLTTAKDYGTPGGKYYFWKGNYDGPELVISGVHDMTISGANSPDGAMTAQHHTITAAPRYANVLSFQFCDNINLQNFTAGHTKETGLCSGGVLAFQNCSTVKIDTCRMYGCGTLGIEAYSSNTMTVNGCEIYDCNQGGAYFGQTDGITFTDCRIHDVDGPALAFYECGDKLWNGTSIIGLQGQYSIAADGSLAAFDKDTCISEETPVNTTDNTKPKEMNPVVARRVAEGELRRLQELGVLNPEIAFEGDLEYCAYTDERVTDERTFSHGFYARDNGGKYSISFRMDDAVKGDIRSATIEAKADENEPTTGSTVLDGQTYYYYDNFKDIFPVGLTVGKLCDLLTQYWGYTGWRLADIYDISYGEEFKAPSEDTLVSDLPEGNYYATVYFDGDQEGAPMYIQKMHFPGRVCFMFGESHAVG